MAICLRHSGQGSSIKHVHTEGEGGLSKVNIGEGVFKPQWTSTNCTILDNYCNILLPVNMAYHILRHDELGAVLHSNFDFHMFYLLIYF